jgi:hypothetical protein
MYCSNTCKTLACREARKNEKLNWELRKQTDTLIAELKQQEVQKAAEEAHRKAKSDANFEELCNYFDEQKKKWELDFEAQKNELQRKRQKKLAGSRAYWQESDKWTNFWINFISKLADQVMKSQICQQKDQ